MLNRSKFIALLMLVCAWPALAWGQQEMRSSTKGSSTPLPITGSAIDADHNGLDVNIVGGSAGVGGTEYGEDTAHVSGDKVTMAGVVQQAADAALSTDGDRSVLQVDSNGYLKVNIKAGAGSGGTAMTDDAAFTPATTTGTPAFFMFDDVAPDSVNEGDGGIGRMSANRNQYVTIRDAAGNERGLNIDANGALAVGSVPTDPFGANADAASAAGSISAKLRFIASIGIPITGTVTVGSHAVTNAGIFATQPTSVVPGTGATNLGKAEDAAHTTGDTGVAILAKRTDTPATSGGTDGDYVTINSDAAGYVYTVPRSSGSTGAAPPDRASYLAGLASGATGGFLTGIPVADSFANINVSTATTTLLVTGVSGRHVRISSLNLLTAGANNVALISGTGATCGTGTTGMNGGTTAASGWNFAANSGITQGNGLGTINQTNATGDSVCIVTSAATQLSGRLAYAIY